MSRRAPRQSDGELEAEVLVCEDHGPVRVLRLNRPERKSALSGALVWAIVDAAEASSLGLVGEVVEAVGFGERFLEYCAQLDHVAPIAAIMEKRKPEFHGR